MVGAFSERLVDRLSKGIEVSEADKKVAAYGIEGVISSTIGYGLVLSLGVIFQSFAEAVIFSILFSALRQYVGGYHAKTFIVCKCTVCIIFMIEVCLSRFLIGTYPFILGNIAGVWFLFVVWKYAPVRNENKRYYEGQIERLKKAGRRLCVTVYVCSIPFYFLNRKVYCIFIATMTIVMLFMMKEVKRDETGGESEKGSSGHTCKDGGK